MNVSCKAGLRLWWVINKISWIWTPRRLFWQFPQPCVFLFIATLLVVPSLALQCLLVQLPRKGMSRTEVTLRPGVWTWIPGLCDAFLEPRIWGLQDWGCVSVLAIGQVTLLLLCRYVKGKLQRKETDVGVWLLEAEEGQKVGHDLACVLGVQWGTVSRPCSLKLPAVVNWKKEFISGNTFLLFDVASPSSPLSPSSLLSPPSQPWNLYV